MPVWVPELSATEVLVTPQDKLADCLCRGGEWEGGDEFGYCKVGDKITGKYYSKAARGCAPIPGIPYEMTSPGLVGKSRYPLESKYWPWVLGGVFALVIGSIYFVEKRKKKKVI